jgi:hypothetical protein
MSSGLRHAVALGMEQQADVCALHRVVRVLNLSDSKLIQKNGGTQKQTTFQRLLKQNKKHFLFNSYGFSYSY